MNTDAKAKTDRAKTGQPDTTAGQPPFAQQVPPKPAPRRTSGAWAIPALILGTALWAGWLVWLFG